MWSTMPLCWRPIDDDHEILANADQDSYLKNGLLGASWMSVSSTASRLSEVPASIAVADRGWHPAGRPARVLYASLVVLFAALMVTCLIGYWTHSEHFNDFFAFDSFSRFVHHYKPSSIYDQALLRGFQAMPEHKMFVFMYPPTMLILVWPLALVPYALGYALWIGVGLVACAAVVGMRRGAWPLPLLLAVAPSTLWTELCGQSTLMLAALLLTGMLLSARRPVLAGLLIGLATYKPQLGILVPVALVAAGQWRTMAAAAATFLTVVFVTTTAFGSDIWLAWASHIGSIVGVRTRHTSEWAPLLVTISSDLAIMGFGKQVADLGQATAFVATAVCIWRCFRTSDPGRSPAIRELKVAALAAATFLATPFAFIYDLPLFTMALLLFVDERRRAGEPFHSAEILVIVAGLLAPYIFLIDGVHGCGSVVILLMLLTILRRIRMLSTGGHAVAAAGKAPATA